MTAPSDHRRGDAAVLAFASASLWMGAEVVHLAH